jgi:hypothetical protein
MINTPMTVPKMDPIPPLSDVPPITTPPYAFTLEDYNAEDV